MESSAAEGITVDPEFIAGVQLGIGCFNLVIYLSVHLSITTVCLFVTSSYPFIHQIQLSIHSSDPIIHPFITTVYSSIHHIQLSIHPSHPVIHPFVTSSYPSIRHIQLSIHSSHPVIHPFITTVYSSLFYLSIHIFIHPLIPQMISLLPQRILKLLEFVGFSGNQLLGLQELSRGARSTTIHSPMCTTFLLFYHTVATVILGKINCLVNSYHITSY